MKYLILFLILLFPFKAFAETTYKRLEDAATTITFGLWLPDATAPITNATCASGDIKCTCDEGAEANATNCFVDEGSKYSLALSSAEMGCKRFSCNITDQGTAAYLSKNFTVETYGTSGTAQHDTTSSGGGGGSGPRVD